MSSLLEARSAERSTGSSHPTSMMIPTTDNYDHLPHILPEVCDEPREFDVTPM